MNNYYAVKFIEDHSGPVPALRLVRYAVIDGREGPHVERALPSSLRSYVFNRCRVEAHGSDFTILAILNVLPNRRCRLIAVAPYLFSIVGWSVLGAGYAADPVDEYQVKAAAGECGL